MLVAYNTLTHYDVQRDVAATDGVRVSHESRPVDYGSSDLANETE